MFIVVLTKINQPVPFTFFEFEYWLPAYLVLYVSWSRKNVSIPPFVLCCDVRVVTGAIFPAFDILSGERNRA